MLTGAPPTPVSLRKMLTDVFETLVKELLKEIFY